MTQSNGLPVGLPSIIGGAEDRESERAGTTKSIRRSVKHEGWWRVEVSFCGVFKTGWAMCEADAAQVANGLLAALEQELRRGAPTNGVE